MKLIHQLCILLLINFTACSSEEEDTCYVEYMKHNACYHKGGNLLRGINATAGDPDMLRSEINRYCDSGFKYLQCIENIDLLAPCQEIDFMSVKNQVFQDKVTKFFIEYFCRNEGEAVFKIVANNGVRSILETETGETFRGCIPVGKPSEYYTPINELFCRDVDAVAGCFIQKSDKTANQDISGIIRDVITQLKVIVNCAAAA